MDNHRVQEVQPGLRYAVVITMGWAIGYLNDLDRKILSDREKHDLMVKAWELITTADGLNNEMLVPDEELDRKIRQAERRWRETVNAQRQVGADSSG